MRIEDIFNRWLLMDPNFADTITYTYDAGGLVAGEVRTVKSVLGNVVKTITITYTRDGSTGNVTSKTVVITTSTNNPIP